MLAQCFCQLPTNPTKESLLTVDASDEPRHIPDDWYKEGFGALYPVVYAHRTVEAAAPEAAFAAAQLGLTAEDRLLDLCCGTGRHLVHLARRTSHVAGLDYSPDLLCLARRALGAGIPLLRADMRRIPFTGAFDCITSFFTSFAYFPKREENLGVVRETARALRLGGRFFIDYLNPGFVVANLAPESNREVGEYHVRERRWIAGERVNKLTEVRRGGDAVARWTESVALYDEAAFVALLKEGGLRPDHLFGDYDGSPVDVSRPRMIAVGRRD